MKTPIYLKGLIIACLLILISFPSIAQTTKPTLKAQKVQSAEVSSKPNSAKKFAQSFQRVYELTDTRKLAELEAEFNARNAGLKANAKSYALLNNIPMRVVTEDKTMELMQILEDGTPIYYETKNVDAAVSTRTNYLNTGGGLGLNLNGDDLTANVWDGGHGRITHQEYDGDGGSNRLTLIDTGTEGGTQLNFHAAHVTGTIMASGQGDTTPPINGDSPDSKGMAWQCDVRGAMWNNDEAEAAAEAAAGMLVSNHSYGFRGDLIPDEWFGAYIQDSEDWDNIMYNAPYYLMVVAAGNDGQQDAYNAAPLSGNSAYDKLSGHGTSKNNLVVANGQDAIINPDGSLNSVTRSASSSEGPTDDFRIKPDIMGNGSFLTSTFEGADDEYGTISGTSMASPNVSGTLLLLQEHYNNLHSNFMRAATLKGLALHTADDAGSSGPDAQYGWGLLNAKKAAETITTAHAASGSAIVEELTLTQGQIYQITVQSNGTDPLQASISWTDPAGNGYAMTTPPPFSANANNPTLVNDLDIRLNNGTSFEPWRLTAVDANGTGDNSVDPYERIDINGASGTYTLTVTHKGTLSAAQDYTLIVTGVVVAATPVIAYASTSGSENEDSECSFTDVNIPLTIAQQPSANATVDFSVSGGTATEGLDFDIQTASVVFPTGSTASQNLVVRVYHDSFIEGDETVTIDFTVNPNGGDASADTNNDSFTLTINDDDLAPIAINTINVFTEDFEDITGWINTESLVDNQLWIFVTGLDGVGDFVGRAIGSVTNDTPIGGPGNLYDPENYLISEAITIPTDATNTAFTYSVYGASSALEFYTLRWATDISTFAAIDGSQLIEERFATANTADTRTVNLNNIAGETGHFVLIHDNPAAPSSSHGLLIMDTASIDVTIETFVQTAVNTGTPDQVNLPTNGTVYSSDPTSGNIMASIVNNNDDDYGCVDIAVSRAGLGAQSYNGSVSPNLVMDKTFDFDPSLAIAAGNATTTFYFEEDEINGWETATSLNRSALMIAREVGGTIQEIVIPTVGAFGTEVTLTANFTGLEGTYYFGTAASFVPLCAGTNKTWDGSVWSPAGAPTLDDSVVINGTYNTGTHGDIEACSITINSGEILTINPATYAHVEGNIIVFGTASLIVEHEGIVVQNNPTASVLKSLTATINVEITTPVLNNRDFMVMGSPMDSEERTGVFNSAFLVLNSTPANFMPHPGVPTGGTNFADDKLNNGKFWDAYNGAITVGEGFIVRPQTGYADPAGITYDMTYSLGTLNNGDVSRPIIFNGLGDNPSGTPNILSNPYASPISASSLITNNGLVNEVYFWEHLTPPSTALPGSNFMNFSMDDISMHNGSMGMPAANDPGVGTTPNGVISTGQGFAIKAQAGGTVTFTNTMRLTSGNNTLRNSENTSQIDKLTLEVRNSDFGVGGYAGIAFNPTATMELDPSFDSNRLATIVSLFSHLQDGSQQLGIQTLPQFDASMKIPMGFTTQVEADLEYVVSIASSEGDQITNTTVYLVDNLLGTITNLSDGDYVFRSEKTFEQGRFTVQFVDEAILGTQDNLLQTIILYPNPTNSLLSIASPQSGIQQVVITDISGRKMQTVTFNDEPNVQVDMSTLNNALYFVTVTTEVGSITKGVVKK